MNAVRVKTFVVGTALVAALALGAVATRAQSSATPPRPGSDPALAAILAELRGLRSDLAGSNQRLLAAQVLVGRLQMQEQRIAYLDAQRASGATKLTETSRAVKDMSDRLGVLVPACPTMGDANQRRDCDQQVDAEKGRVARMQETERQLRMELIDMENAVATEQRRWSDFNDRLDTLERAISTAPGR